MGVLFIVRVCTSLRGVVCWVQVPSFLLFLHNCLCSVVCYTHVHVFSCVHCSLLQELRLMFPNAQRLNRGNYVMSQLVQACIANDITDLIIIHEHRGDPGTLSNPHVTMYYIVPSTLSDSWKIKTSFCMLSYFLSLTSPSYPPPTLTLPSLPHWIHSLSLPPLSTPVSLTHLQCRWSGSLSPAVRPHGLLLSL